MKNKAFTLIELMGVVIVLGLIALIAIPAIGRNIKNTQNKVYDSQIKRIEDAASDWGLEHINLLPIAENATITIRLDEHLQRGGYLPACVLNPKTGHAFKASVQIVIKNENNTKYSYTVVNNADLKEDTGIKCDE